MEKRRKHKHTDISFSAGFLLCIDHNTFAATFIMRSHFKTGTSYCDTYDIFV